jgi:DNA-binding transcriptional MocR family regulator
VARFPKNDIISLIGEMPRYDLGYRFYEGLAREGARVANGIWFGDEALVFRLGFSLLSKSDLASALARLSTAVRRISGD